MTGSVWIDAGEGVLGSEGVVGRSGFMIEKKRVA